ncbi:MAG: hypothetical protein ACI4PO_06610, partial [Faecousia sp.]
THTCSKCGDHYVDSYTDPTGHDYDAVVTDPTCTEKGYTTHTCSKCGDHYVDSYTDPTGHDYDAVVTDPTCTGKGYTTHTCSKCGDHYVDSYTDPTGHDFGDDGICHNCGALAPDDSENSATGDTFSSELWMTLLVISVLGAAAVVVSKRSWLSKK